MFLKQCLSLKYFFCLLLFCCCFFVCSCYAVVFLFVLVMLLFFVCYCFFFFFKMKGSLKKDPNQVLGVHEKFFAGSTAGVIAQTAIYPMEVCFFLSDHESLINIINFA